MKKFLKIGYFADGPWAHGAFDLLNDSSEFSIMFVCARFENPDSILRQKAELNQIDFLVNRNVNCPDFIDQISRYECDIFVSMSFNQILRPSLYEMPQLGTINCHAGKLPFYRGRNILNWALINDEIEFGITVHYVDDGVDTGDIILQKTYPITDEDNYSSLLHVAYQECPSVLFEAIKLIALGNHTSTPQNLIHPVGTVFSQRIPGDELINWSSSSREVFNFVRALSVPGPAAQAILNNQIIYIDRVAYIENAPCYKCIPGAILAKDTQGFLVKTGNSFIRLLEWRSTIPLRVGMRFDQ